MTLDEITDYIRRLMPDAEVAVRYRPGGMDHVSLTVMSDTFKDMNLMDRQRLVYKALSEPMQQRRLKAVAVKTDVKGGPLAPKDLPTCE